jgi:dienelactone hydrolase
LSWWRLDEEVVGMRQDIQFDAEGVTLRGWLYRPDQATGPVPTVVMAHGLSCVKEMCGHGQHRLKPARRGAVSVAVGDRVEHAADVRSR